MKKFKILLVAIVALTGCMTDAKVAREAYARGICPTAKDSIRIKDSIAIHWRDSSRNIPAKDGGEVTFNFGDNCDSIKKAFAALKKNPIVHKQNGITETIGSKDGKTLDFNCKEDAYKLKLDSAYEVIEVYKSRYEELVKVEKPICNLPHRNWVDHLGRWALFVLIISIISIFLYLYFRLKKGKI